jgi:RNA polymerase sigma-70 factor (ECF subfamily)
VKREFDIKKVQQGDTVAFREFFACMYPKLMALACRFVDEATANDMVQDVFVSYWEKKNAIDAENIKSYLFKWLQNNCLNHLKHNQIAEDYAISAQLAAEREAFHERISDTNETLTAIMGKDILETVNNSLRKLPARCAEAFKLCYFNDLNYKEIAATMKISPRTVEGHIRLAAKLLRNELKDILMLALFMNIA